MAHSNHFYFGWTSAPRPNWKALVVEPRAPSNYKDEVKIRRYIDEARRSQEAEVRRLGFVAMLNSVCVIDDAGALAFASSGSTPGQVSIELAEWMKGQFPTGLSSEQGYGLGHPIIGFDIQQMLSIMHKEVMLANRTQRASNPLVLPPRLWYNASAADPYEVLTTGEERKHVSIFSVLHALEVEVPPDLLTSPRAQAEAARELATINYFFPTVEELGLLDEPAYK